MKKQETSYYFCPYVDHICGSHSQCTTCLNPFNVEAIYIDTDCLHLSIPIKSIRFATSRPLALYHLARNIITILLARLCFDKYTINELLKDNSLPVTPMKEGEHNVHSLSP